MYLSNHGLIQNGCDKSPEPVCCRCRLNMQIRLHLPGSRRNKNQISRSSQSQKSGHAVSATGRYLFGDAQSDTDPVFHPNKADNIPCHTFQQNLQFDHAQTSVSRAWLPSKCRCQNTYLPFRIGLLTSFHRGCS